MGRLARDVRQVWVKAEREPQFGSLGTVSLEGERRLAASSDASDRDAAGGRITSRQLLTGAAATLAILISLFVLSDPPPIGPAAATSARVRSGEPAAPPGGGAATGWAALDAAEPGGRRDQDSRDGGGAHADEAEALTRSRTVAIARNGTLIKAMMRGGARAGDAHRAIAALKMVYDPRQLKPGQRLTLTFTGGTQAVAQGELVAVALAVDVDRQVVALRTGAEGFVAEDVKTELSRALARVEGTINDSLFVSATEAGMPPPVIMEVIRLFSWDVDFQRDIHPGDRFEVLFERFIDEAGRVVKPGAVAYAALSLGDAELELYRHRLADGTADHFDAAGRTVRKALLRTPVNGGRLSSRYGKRRHPVLGYTRMHRGIDFAAPRGTPIMAAGDGVIERAGRNGAYGKYVRIRHNARYKTAYGHLKSTAKGIRRGKRVRQGQIIGTVGSTGRSTGPHLHYEVLASGRQVNPMRVKLPSGRKLAGAELARFEATRTEITAALAAAPLLSRLAQSE